MPTAFVLTVVLIGLLRASYEVLSGEAMRIAGVRRRAILVGEGPSLAHLHQAIGSNRSGITYDFLGVVSDGPGRRRPAACSGRSRACRPCSPARQALDELILTDSDFSERQLLDIVEQAHRRGVQVRVAPKTTALLTERAEYIPGQGTPLFELRPPAFAGSDWVVKRAFDLVVSVLVIVLGLPIWLAIAAAIKLGSRGPVLYRDRRIGLNEQPFRMLKFRTMYADAAERQGQLEAANEAEGALFKIRDDPRVTPVGRFLRRLLARRDPAGAERPPRRDEPRRPEAAARARLRAPRGLAPQALPRAARDDGAVADRRPCRSRPSTTSSAWTSTTSRIGRSGSTSPSSPRPCRPCSARAAPIERASAARLLETELGSTGRATPASGRVGCAPVRALVTGIGGPGRLLPRRAAARRTGTRCSAPCSARPRTTRRSRASATGFASSSST